MSISRSVARPTAPNSALCARAAAPAAALRARPTAPAGRRRRKADAPPWHRHTIPTAMASTVTAAASLRLAFPLLSAPSSNTLCFPLRCRYALPPLAVVAFKKLSEASLVPIPH